MLNGLPKAAAALDWNGYAADGLVGGIDEQACLFPSVVGGEDGVGPAVE